MGDLDLTQERDFPLSVHLLTDTYCPPSACLSFGDSCRQSGHQNTMQVMWEQHCVLKLRGDMRCEADTPQTDTGLCWGGVTLSA